MIEKRNPLITFVIVAFPYAILLGIAIALTNM